MPPRAGHHRVRDVGWLRAAVLGANDGILSTASLVLGVAAAHGTHGSVLIAGTAGLVAGAMSMASGEYVSVHSQADAERSELALRRGEPTARDVPGAHAPGEPGVYDTLRARPMQAALASGAGFAAGAAMPLLVATATAETSLIPVVSASSLASLALLGAWAAWVGRARMATGALRVTFWGAFAMAATAGVGSLVGAAR